MTPETKQMSTESPNTVEKDPHNQWETNIELESPSRNSNNWSWHEVGNEQYQICEAPDSSLPILPPEDTTPLEIRYPLEKEADVADTNVIAGKIGQGAYIELEDGTAVLVG
ncbi:13292_t:CDS:2 [Funneliformis geosporum]|uniref:4243_t:CDS:1 n=1 Tax=Funneliformis geosporum TaxID=1117311 RepID=A0A9W4WUJ4_9GLOM|nr:13292_t:CDS:2 [Funneliformis geosporum]CAI2173189.1 4243_t:CDS:2 [Funneliformis geosporum]